MVNCAVSINHTIHFYALLKDYETCGLQYQKALHLFVCLTHCRPKCWVRWTGEQELPVSGVCVVSKLMIIVLWRRPDWGKSHVSQRYWKSEGHWATWFRYSAYLRSSYQVNSSTVQPFNKAMPMPNTARPSAYVLREVFVGRICSCGLLPAHSSDCNAHDFRCMTIVVRCSGLTLTLTFMELKKNIQWEASCNLQRRTLLHVCIFFSGDVRNARKMMEDIFSICYGLVIFFMCRGLKFAGSSSILSGGTYFMDKVQWFVWNLKNLTV